MKKLSIKINGSSKIAFVRFFKKDVSTQLDRINDDDFDLVDFIDENCDKSVFFGRGFSTDEKYNIQVNLENCVIYDGEVFSYEGFDLPLEDIKRDFEEFNGVKFENVLTSNVDFDYSADMYMFKDANNFKICCLEIIDAASAKDSLELEVDEDFVISDLRIVLLAGDTGKNESITQEIFVTTYLDTQIFGISYNDVFYEFKGGNFEGFSSEYFWFKREGHSWSRF